MHHRFAILITGLPSSGKTTMALEIRKALNTSYEIDAALIDGDEVRKKFYPELGFKKVDRLKNLDFITGLALGKISEGRSVICSTIGPYEEGRRKFVSKLERSVPTFLIYMSTPLSICEKRDNKGLYRRARIGEITNLTGIDSTYEIPVNPDFLIDSSTLLANEAAEEISRQILDNLIFKKNRDK